MPRIVDFKVLEEFFKKLDKEDSETHIALIGDTGNGKTLNIRANKMGIVLEIYFHKDFWKNPNDIRDVINSRLYPILVVKKDVVNEEALNGD